jgi:hypothetical protein
MNRIPEQLACKQLVELVTEYLEEALTPDDRAKFEEHIKVCGHCREYLQQIQDTMNIAGAVPTQPPASETRARLLDIYREFLKQ